LPPSIRTNAEEVIRVVRNIPLPISHIEVEDVLIDIAKLNNPELKGKEYQESNRLDENLRLATLLRDGFKCMQCKKKNLQLHAHQCKKKNLQLHAHRVIWKSKGGKDTIGNMLTLCKVCYDKVHKGVLELGVKGVSNLRDVVAQRTMQGKTYMYDELSKSCTLSKVFGYETSEYRKSLDLPKTHIIDALCVATLRDGEVIKYHEGNQYRVSFRAKQTRKRYWTQPKKGKGRVRYQVNEELEGFRKGDLVEVEGCLKQVNSIYSNGVLAFPRVKGEPSSASPKKCKLVEKCKTIGWKQVA
jgi:hypothetical protein